MSTRHAPPVLNPRPVTRLGLLRWVGTCVLLFVVLVTLAAGVTGALRWSVLDADALATMRQPRPPADGASGFADLYVANFDVPADQADAMFAAELAYLQALGPGGERRPGVALPPRPLRSEAAPVRPSIASGPGGCPVYGCLAHVEANLEETRVLVATQAARIARLERAFAAANLRSPFPDGPHAPLAGHQQFRLLLAAAALDAIDGRVVQAYARTCSAVASMRRLSGDAGSLIEKMVGVGFARGAAVQLLELRRRHPLATLLGECAEAVAPLRSEEALLCEAARGEFRMHAAITAGLKEKTARVHEPRARVLGALLYDWELQDGWFAAAYMGLCSSDRVALAARGLRAPEPPPSVQLGSVRCAAAWGSCSLASIPGGELGKYADRALDENAILRLLLAAHAVADGRMTPHDAVAASALEAYPVHWDASGPPATIALVAPAQDQSGEFTVDFAGLAPAAAR